MQVPFRLSAFAFRLSALSLLLLALGSSCGFNPDMQTKGQAWLQGEWKQDSVPGQKKLLNYSLYDLKFSCDSFFVSIHSFTKVNAEGDSCIKHGEWTEYWKGTYTQKNDTLHLKGEFCEANKRLKDEGGCFRSGVNEEFYKITKISDSLVQFASATSVIPINARLVKRTSCVPKPL